MTTTAILAHFRKQRIRITRIRRTLLELFCLFPTPWSAVEILESLHKRHLHPNKTTVYRELEFFKQHNVIQEVRFDGNAKRYELRLNDHHHHLICNSCKSVQDVDVTVNLENEEHKIARRQGFNVLEHSLEFFGLCHRCQSHETTK
ncbi:MAG: transcriptional repressor [Candidatus Kerfeldbacteria bacterium]|nr:transcriptional repressor [Candidatus Kerfeldbacteria bacterium]